MCKHCGHDSEVETVWTGYVDVPVALIACCEYGAMLENSVPEKEVAAYRLSTRRKLVIEYFQRDCWEEVDIPF